MKKEENYYGIYINNKIPKTKDDKKHCNKYNRSIKLKFEGRAYLLKSNEEKEELKNNSKFKKNGRYTIQFINDKNEIYYIEILIRRYVIILLFLIAFFIILGSLLLFKLYKQNNFDASDFLNFDFVFSNHDKDTNDSNKNTVEDDLKNDLDNAKYVFNINYKNTKFQSMTLDKSIKNQDFIYPGTEGYFYIEISTKNGNRDMIYSMQVQEEADKPSNLKFEIDGKIYNSMKELAKGISGYISKDSDQILKIRWFWEYENGDGDIEDTNDGLTLETYKVLMRIIGSEKGE